MRVVSAECNGSVRGVSGGSVWCECNGCVMGV